MAARDIRCKDHWHNYLGSYASDAVALAYIRLQKWDTNGDGTGDPQNGMFYYSTDTTGFRAYLNSAWGAMVVPGASDVVVDTANFDGILSAADSDAQTALETIDDLGFLDSTGNIYFGVKPYTSTMYYFWNDNLEVGSWTDKSAAIKAGTATNMFPDVDADSCGYLGCTARAFPAWFMNVTTAIVLGGGTVTLDYWNGAAWATDNAMVTKWASPYTSYANTLFGNVQKDNVRHATPSDWATKALDGVTAYWLRFRVTVGITTSPAVDNITLLGDSTKINTDGVTEYYGAAMGTKVVGDGSILGVSKNLTDYAPAAGSLLYSSTLNPANLKVTKNTWLADTFIDGIGSAFVVPAWMDTSRPITINFSVMPDGVGAGNAEIGSEYVIVTPTYATATGATYAGGDIIAMPGVANTRAVGQITFSAPTAMGLSDVILFNMARDAQAGNLDDTYAGSVFIDWWHNTVRAWRD